MIVPTPFKLRNCNPKKLINAEAQPELGAFRRERRGITLQSFKNGSILTIVLCVSAFLRWNITWVCHASILVVGPFVFRGGSGIPPGLDTPVFRRSNQRNDSLFTPFPHASFLTETIQNNADRLFCRTLLADFATNPPDKWFWIILLCQKTLYLSWINKNEVLFRAACCVV